MIKELLLLLLLLSRLPRPWSGEGEAIGTVPLLRAEGGEEEPQVGWLGDIGVGETKTKETFRINSTRA